MPELPEVETVRAGLEMAVSGKTIRHVHLARADLRAPFPPRFAEMLEGRRIESVSRRAKYLLIQLEGGLTWLAHLGMSGRFTVTPAAPAAYEKHDHVRVAFADGAALTFNDARRFGVMDAVETASLAAHPMLVKLGPEPFSGAFNPVYLAAQLQARRGPVKPALMDQALVVGVGNIYASEALFYAGIHPHTPACEAAAQAGPLHGAICKVLKEAIASGGSSLRDFVHIGGEAGYFQHRFAVYGREGKPCPACGSAICKTAQAARSTFFCATCQKGAGKPPFLPGKPRKSGTHSLHPRHTKK